MLIHSVRRIAQAALVAFVAIFALTTQAHASLSAVGATDPVSGVPSYYSDSLGNQIAFCVDDPNCGPTPALSSFLNPDQSGEAFYWRGVSDPVSVGGGQVQMVAAVEAAFPNGPNPQTFLRMRFQAKSAIHAGDYTASTPYGDLTFTSDGIKRNLGNGDVICLQATINGPCDFASILGHDVQDTVLGTYLKSTTAPAGYYGNGATPSTVTGGNAKLNPVTGVSSPVNTFTVSDGASSGTTDQWTITGKMFDPAAPPLVAPVPPPVAPRPVVTAPALGSSQSEHTTTIIQQFVNGARPLAQAGHGYAGRVTGLTVRKGVARMNVPAGADVIRLTVKRGGRVIKRITRHVSGRRLGVVLTHKAGSYTVEARAGDEQNDVTTFGPTMTRSFRVNAA